MPLDAPAVGDVIVTGPFFVILSMWWLQKYCESAGVIL